MKKIFVVLAVLAMMIVLAGCGGNNATPEVVEPTSVQDAGTQVAEPEATPDVETQVVVPAPEAASLVGVWDWEGMAGAIILEADGRYSWLGVDYSALGYRWESNNGVVSYRLGTVSVEWFTYQFIDDNTMDIEYAATPGIIYRLQRSQ